MYDNALACYSGANIMIRIQSFIIKLLMMKQKYISVHGIYRTRTTFYNTITIDEHKFSILQHTYFSSTYICC